MMAPVKRALLILGLLLLASCRSVWVHPEATEEKYAADLFFCQRGVELDEWQASGGAVTETRSERVWALNPAVDAVGGMRPDWKQCMVALGWHTVARSRRNPAWMTPDPPPSAGRPGAKRR